MIEASTMISLSLSPADDFQYFLEKLNALHVTLRMSKQYFIKTQTLYHSR